MKTNKTGSKNGIVKLKKKFDHFMEKHTAWVKPVWVENVYIASLVVFVLTSIIMSYYVYANTMDNAFLKMLKYAAIGMASLKIVILDIRAYSGRRLLVSCTVLLLLLVSVLVSGGNKNALWTAVMVIASYGVDFRKTLKQLMIWEIILVSGVILLSLFGLIPDRIFMRGDVIRHSLGFKYSTYVPFFFFSIVCMFLYLQKGRIKLYECLLIVCMAVMVYALTNTRLEPALAVLLTVWMFAYQKLRRGWIERVNRFLVRFVVIVAALVSVVAVQMYNPADAGWKKLNGFTSDRLSLSREVFDEYGVHLFGSKIEWVGLSHIYEGSGTMEEYNAVDNMYLKLLVQYGLVVLMIFMVAQFALGEKAIKKNDYYLQTLIIFFAFYSLLNPHTYELAVNPYLLILGGSLVKTKGENDKT